MFSLLMSVWPQNDDDDEDRVDSQLLFAQQRMISTIQKKPGDSNTWNLIGRLGYTYRDVDPKFLLVVHVDTDRHKYS